VNRKKWLEKILLGVKGFFIGSGFILPGVSGGAMAAIFGIYERLISFIADIRKDFKKNIIYFSPVIVGAVAGLFVFSVLMTALFESYEPQMRWFFIGCIVGTLPALEKQSRKKGRTRGNVIAAVVTFLIATVILVLINYFTVGVSNAEHKEFPIWSWVIAGVTIGLGVIVPGLSPSNFLVLFGMYGSMSYGISTLDFFVIIPLALGMLVCVFALAKVMKIFMERKYAAMFHFILGIVLASTLLIIPLDYNYLQLATLVCVLAMVLGALLGRWMSNLEEKYVPEK